MLADKQGKKLNKYVEDYVVFDLETTGVYCNSDQVIEISAVKVKGGKVVDEYTTLVNPGIPISPGASAVNGITDDMVADAPPFEEAFAGFLEFAGDSILVGHNIQSFDLKFLYRDARKFWKKTLDNDYIDTLYMARACLPQLSHHKLVDLAAHYGISQAGAHRALNDCRMNQKVFEMMGEEMKDPSATAKKIKKCPRCGSILKMRSGRFGDFWGCSGYPDCRYTEDA